MSDPLAVHIPPLGQYKPGPVSPTVGNRSSSGDLTTQRPTVTTSAHAGATPAPAQRRATRGFNVLIWRGRLATDPQMIISPNGTRFVRIRCLQDQPDRNGQPGVQAIEAVLFAERAEQFAAFFRKGDEILMKGRLTIENSCASSSRVRSCVSPSLLSVSSTKALTHPGGAIDALLN
jgi:Single-strand binding protein family